MVRGINVIDNDKQILIEMDFNPEWDAETFGKEPDYDGFIEKLADLIFILSTGRPVSAMLLYRRFTQNLREELEKEHIKYKREPYYTFEVILHKFFGIFGDDFDKGSGLLCEIIDKQDLLTFFSWLSGPYEPVLFVFDKPNCPYDLFGFEPFYRAKDKNSFFAMDVVKENSILVYHESWIKSADIMIQKSIFGEDLFSKIQRCFDDWTN